MDRKNDGKCPPSQSLTLKRKLGGLDRVSCVMPHEQFNLAGQHLWCTDRLLLPQLIGTFRDSCVLELKYPLEVLHLQRSAWDWIMEWHTHRRWVHRQMWVWPEGCTPRA